MARVWQWLKDNAIVISPLVTLLALVVTCIISVQQLGLTRLSLQNNLIYQMQKDERAIGSNYEAGVGNAGDMFAEMQSVYIQYKLGSIPGSVWPLFTEDFCKLMSNEHLRREWDSMTKAAFSDDFVAYLARIQRPGSQDCGGGVK
jgi:hypothetical protein